MKTTRTIHTAFVFTSESNPAKTYQTLIYSDGFTSCDCPGWTRRNPPGGRTCKHVRLVAAGLAETQCAGQTRGSGAVVRLPQGQAVPTRSNATTLTAARRAFERDEE